MIMLAIMIGCPLIFRYVICWNGSIRHYAAMFGMTLLMAVLMRTTASIEGNQQIVGLKDKCSTNPAACLILARMSIAKHDYKSAIYYSEQGALLSSNHTLQQMNVHAKLLANLNRYHHEVQNWLYQFPDDYLIRQSYVNELISHGQLDQALVQCRYLYEQCQDPQMKSQLKNQMGDLNQLLIMGGTQ